MTALCVGRLALQCLKEWINLREGLGALGQWKLLERHSVISYVQ
jgi:hypothetical protein